MKIQVLNCTEFVYARSSLVTGILMKINVLIPRFSSLRASRFRKIAPPPPSPRNKNKSLRQLAE